MLPHAGQPIAVAGAPLGLGRAAMIMMHGRGAAPSNILELVPAFGHPEFTYIAPAAAGNTWYPKSFMAPIAENEPGISSGIAVIHGLVLRLEALGLPRERIVLLGFSQGACLTSTYAVRHAARFGGIVLYTGGLIGPPGTVWAEAGTFGGAPVFLGCSDVDAHVPLSRVRESETVFTRMGAAVTARVYPGMGHLVNEDEIAAARDLLAAASDRVP